MTTLFYNWGTIERMPLAHYQVIIHETFQTRFKNLVQRGNPSHNEALPSSHFGELGLAGFNYSESRPPVSDPTHLLKRPCKTPSTQIAWTTDKLKNGPTRWGKTAAALIHRPDKHEDYCLYASPNTSGRQTQHRRRCFGFKERRTRSIVSLSGKAALASEAVLKEISLFRC